MSTPPLTPPDTAAAVRGSSGPGPGGVAAPIPAPPDLAVTLHVRDTCLCLHVQRAARVLARRFDEALKPAGLTNGQFSMLMSLNRPAPARMREVAVLLGMDRTTLTAALKTLEKRGLVASSIDQDDRRGRLMTLTTDGRAKLAQAVPIWQREHAALDKEMGNLDGLRQRLNDVAQAARRA